MPIFEYFCKGCNKTYEIFLQTMEKEPKKCEKCDGKLERIISTTSFILKGEGWGNMAYTKKPKKA